jgi:GT2 family glycosyltransferase
LNWNTKDLTKECIDSIRSSSTDVEFNLIVVDNGSSDGSVEWLQSEKNCHVIYNKENNGFAKGVNQGIRAGNAEYICCLNSDTIVTKQWLSELVNGVKKYNCDAVSPMIPTIKNDWMKYVKIKSGYSLLKWCIINRGWPKDVCVNNLNGRKRNMAFACILFKRKIVDTVGYLDERFAIGSCEDLDFCRRAMNEGFKFYFCNYAIVYHMAHSTFTKNRHLIGDYESKIHEEHKKKYIEKWGEW